MNIIFMGTPDFAVPCLARILDEGHTVSAVFTQPDKPKGRGKSLCAPPVKQLALERGIPVYQPIKLRDGAALSLLRGYSPDLIVVVAYGRMLPDDILELPPLGCVNVHASLLPRLRGAAPIQRAIINGDTVTGITTMYMAQGMDTGDMILRRETPIGETETAGELFARLADMGAGLLAESLKLLQAGAAPRTPQDESLATHAPMIEKSIAAINFTKPAHEICNLVRGLNPSPLAFTRFSGGRLCVLCAKPAAGMQGCIPGEVLDAKRLIVACGGGAVELLAVQPEGKRPMENTAFANSGKIRTGEILL
ncbi:MAG: methionyl-tRNA formyltransferase [Oscillospiraceae bacterium]|nr:methionyl-tRNA formyltransferase [Oscillospiraceae bacterium]